MRGLSSLTCSLIVAALAAACGDPAEPAEALSIEIVDGDGQQAVTANGAQTPSDLGWLPDSLRVRVVNNAGNPVAGVTVIWAATGGGIAPNVTTTDVSGSAAARWSWYAPQSGFAPVGTYTATAGVPDVGMVTFSGHARAGLVVHDLTITPDTVDVSLGTAQATVTLHVTDDRLGFGLSYGFAQFNGPAGSSQWVTTPLEQVSGTPMDGVWQGTITVPQDAHLGAWLGHLTLGWGCGGANRIQVTAAKLQEHHLPSQLHVLAAGDDGQRVGHSQRIQSTRGTARPSMNATNTRCTL